jgi:hypothetical protein
MFLVKPDHRPGEPEGRYCRVPILGGKQKATVVAKGDPDAP